VFAEVGLFSSLNEIAFLLFVPSVLQMIGKQELKVLYIIIILYVGASTGPWKAVRIQIAVCTCASPAFVPERPPFQHSPLDWNMSETKLIAVESKNELRHHATKREPQVQSFQKRGAPR
jgi:hypothetical protein